MLFGCYHTAIQSVVYDWNSYCVCCCWISHCWSLFTTVVFVISCVYKQLHRSAVVLVNSCADPQRIKSCVAVLRKIINYKWFILNWTLNSNLKNKSEWTSYHLIQIWINKFNKLHFQGQWENYFTHKSILTIYRNLCESELNFYYHFNGYLGYADPSSQHLTPIKC